jgi:hypothetical protein
MNSMGILGWSSALRTRAGWNRLCSMVANPGKSGWKAGSDGYGGIGRGLLAGWLGLGLTWGGCGVLLGNEPPVILTEPVAVNAVAGERVRFEVTAAGTEPLRYQWRRNLSNVSMARQRVLEYAAVGTQHAGLHSVVVANDWGSVTSRVVTLTLDLPESELSFRLRGSVDGFEVGAGSGAPVRFQVRGRHAFMANGWDDGLYVLDIGDPTEPRVLSKVPRVGSFGRPFDVALIDDFALVAERGDGLGILDISDPAAPVRIGNFKLPGSLASSVMVRGRTAYVGNESAGLVILDVDRPESPVIVGSASPPTRANGVWLEGDLAFVAEWVEGLSLVDVSNLAEPRLVRSIPFGGGVARAFDVVTRGGIAYVADGELGVMVLDALQETGHELTRLFGQVWDVHLAGRYLLAADAQDGLRLLDVSLPTVPVSLGTYADFGRALGIGLWGNRVLLGERRFNVLEFEFPAMAPVITVPTVNRQVSPGMEVTLEAPAMGTEPMLWRWFHGEAEIGVTTVSELTLGELHEDDWGEYHVEVTNAFGMAAHRVATLRPGRQVDPIQWSNPEAGEWLLSGRSYQLTAGTAAGRAVEYALVSGSAELEGDTLMAGSPGDVTVRALALGDGEYLAKAEERRFHVLDRPWIVMESIRWGEGQARFLVEVGLGADYVVWRSDDLAEWRALIQGVAAKGQVEINDEEAGAGPRFYRVEVKP